MKAVPPSFGREHIAEMNIISCDVGWSRGTKRNAVTVVTSEGRLCVFRRGLNDDDLVSLVTNWSGRSLILLDVPIEGCQNLEGPRRPIENDLQHYISLYPASRAGTRGQQLKQRMLLSVPAGPRQNIVVKEIYPHAIYKFLWAVEQEGKLAEVLRHREQSLLDNWFTPSLGPPKYKGRKVKQDERLMGMWTLYNFITQRLRLSFCQSLEPPTDSFSAAMLEVLADQYDSCLGAVVGLYCIAGNPYTGIAGDERQGEMLLFADIWLKRQLEKYGISVKRLPVNPSSA